MFDQPQTIEKIRYVSHRGFTPLAPENSLPAFAYAGMLGQWAIETDVHLSRDGVPVCCHDENTKAMFGDEGLIREMSWHELSCLRLATGNRLECFPREQLRMPLFSEYLSLCRRYGCVPFIELKTGDVDRVLRAVREAGFGEDEAVMSSTHFPWLEDVRKAAPGMFIHHIFSDEIRMRKMEKMGNAGLSLKVDDPLARSVEWIEKAHKAGLRVCLRAADSLQAVRVMLDLGLDYLPTNRMAGAALPGSESAAVSP